MANRKMRAQIAKETVEILQRGEYCLQGSTVSIAEGLEAARQGTRLYVPGDFADILMRIKPGRNESPPSIRVENCTTFAAARRVISQIESNDPLCLNFASAKNPGGGFLSGSQAQEECLARASGLYACIEPVRGYYENNRNCPTSLYTHHTIYSPQVPVFRDDDDRLLADPYAVSIVTSPAVNAGAVRQNEPQRAGDIESTMLERIEHILAVAVIHGHNTLVLGAWGCGVFKNDPADVATWFRRCLMEDERFNRSFHLVVFAVLDRTDGQQTFTAFQKVLRGE